MKRILLFLLFSIPLIGSPIDSKVLPPGSGMGAKPNVLFIIDNSGSMGNSVGSKMYQTKTALHVLFNEPYKSEIITKIRPGLAQFPGGYCNASTKMVFTPIDDATDTQITNILTNVGGWHGASPTGAFPITTSTSGSQSGIYGSGGTPLGNSLYYAGKYFKEKGGGYCIGQTSCPALARAKCQKNYIILFTDGGQNSVCSSLSGGGDGRVETIAGILASETTPYLSDQDEGFKQILTYAIGFGSGASNVDYIAIPGGTEKGYSASDTASLVNTFKQIINNIIASETTNSSPTIVPSFDNGEDEVLYQAVFKPRSQKQWTGTLTKYKLNDDGWVDNTSTVWASSDTGRINPAATREVYTKCNVVTPLPGDKFNTANYEALQPCIALGSNLIPGSADCNKINGSPDKSVDPNFSSLLATMGFSSSDNYPNDLGLLESDPSANLATYLNQKLSGEDLSNGVEIHMNGVDIENGYDYLRIETDLEYKYVVTGSTAYQCPDFVYTIHASIYKRINTSGCTVLASGKNLKFDIIGKPVTAIFYTDYTVTRKWFNIHSIVVKGKKQKTQCNFGTGNGNLTKEYGDLDTLSLRKLIAFINGKDAYVEDGSHDGNICNSETASTCPERKYPLADIYNSRAKYVGKPFQMHPYSSYQTFRESNSARTKMLFVGSNGGMLHAFKADDGKELWAFIPPNLLTFLQNIRVQSEKGSVSKYFVDASPKIMDVWDGSAWKTILLMGFGAGGSGLFAMDITKPDSYGSTGAKFLWAIYNETAIRSDGVKRVLYWNSSGDITVYTSETPVATNEVALSSKPQYDYTRLGDTFSEPIFAQIGSLNGDGELLTSGSNPAGATFYAIVGGGGIKGEQADTVGQSVFILNPLNGSIYNRFDLPDSTVTDIAAKIPATVSVLPDYRKADSREIYSIYVGDLSGRVWRMAPKVSASTQVINCGSASSNCRNIFSVNSASTKRKVHQSIALSFDRAPGDTDANVWVYLGTGNVSPTEINNSDPSTNRVYAIKDSTWRNRGALSVGALTAISSGTDQSVCDAEESNGYYYDIGNDEKLVAAPTIIDGYVYYTTYDPLAGGTADPCAVGLGLSYLYSFKLFTACKNPDMKKDESDPESSYRVKLGPGMATAPVVKGQDIYFGISGKVDDQPELHNAERNKSLIKWRRTKSIADKKTVVPFNYFRELF